MERKGTNTHTRTPSFHKHATYLAIFTNTTITQGQRTRTLHIPVPSTNPTLALTLQWTSLAVVTSIWHVLDVPAASPADTAGLLPYSDYILGSPEGVLHGESGLSEIVEDHINRPLRLWVYNNEYDVTREVTLTPSRAWGGEGALGCVLGYGALHRLPPPLSEPVDAPGEMLFESGGGGEKTPYGGGVAGFADLSLGGDDGVSGDYAAAGLPPGGGNFMVPAQMASAPPLGGAAPPPRSAKKKANRAAVGGIDDYFNEQEQKSRELDRPDSTRTKTNPVAPPPKAGGGPPPAGGGPPPAAEGPPKTEPPIAETPAPESEPEKQPEATDGEEAAPAA